MVAQRGSEVGSTPLRSIANALTIPPIHVDHVAEAVCKAIADDNVDGVVDVARMRDIIGWSLKISFLIYSRAPELYPAFVRCGNGQNSTEPTFHSSKYS